MNKKLQMSIGLVVALGWPSLDMKVSSESEEDNATMTAQQEMWHKRDWNAFLEYAPKIKIAKQIQVQANVQAFEARFAAIKKRIDGAAKNIEEQKQILADYQSLKNDIDKERKTEWAIGKKVEKDSVAGKRKWSDWLAGIKNFFLKKKDEKAKESEKDVFEPHDKNEGKDKSVWFARANVVAELKKRQQSLQQRPQGPHYKYIQSIAHLLTELEGSVNIVPEPTARKEKKTWLWNDGTTEKNVVREEHSVSFRGERYASFSNNIDWIEGKGMPYRVYYDYLVDRKHSTDEFEEFLVQKIIEKMSSSDLIPFVPIFMDVLKKEKEFENYFVFYSGCDGQLSFLYDYISLLEKYLDLDEIHKERSRFEGLKSFATIKDFWADSDVIKLIKKHGKGMDPTFDHEDGVIEYLLSTNMFLFGNAHRSGSCSVIYFVMGRTISSVRHVIKMVMKNVKRGFLLNPEESDIDIKHALREVRQEYADVGGLLKQIFIDPQEVNDVAYICKPYGRPCAQGLFAELVSDVKSMVSKKDPSPWDAPLAELRSLVGRSLYPSDVLALVRNHSELPVFSTNVRGSQMLITALQARLLHSRVNDRTMKIFYYYRNDKERRKHDECKKKLDEIVQKQIWDALKVVKLKPVDLKMQYLYQLVHKK